MDNYSQIIKKLRDLQDSHRLGMHVWENSEPFEFPTFSYDVLTNVDAAAITARILKMDPANPMLESSLSLVPSCGNGNKSMIPYEMKSDKLGNLCYLFDLRQDKAAPPIVLRASPKNLNSGQEPDGKNLSLYSETSIPELDNLYRPYGSQEAKWRQEAAGPRREALGNLQLDALGRHLSAKTYSMPQNHNEIVVAASRHHIAAIGVPLYVLDNKLHISYMKLQGALAGLQHLNLIPPLDVPVVCYHVMPSADIKPGEFTYLGQGREALEDAAKAAWGELKAAGVTDKRKLDLVLGRYATTTELLIKSMEDNLGLVEADLFPPQSHLQEVVRTKEISKQPQQR